MTPEITTGERLSENAQFCTPLRVQLLREWDNGRPKWQLLTPLVFDSVEVDARITVWAGFHTDLASVPRLPVACVYLGVANMAAVVHDAMYRNKTMPRKLCDAVFLEAMQASGVPHLVSAPMYTAVRLFGNAAYNPEFSGWE